MAAVSRCGWTARSPAPYRTPTVAHVELGPPTRLTVRMPEGQVPAALRKAGHLIAPHVGGVALRVVDRGHGWGVVTVLTEDPLAGALPLHLPRTEPGVLLGRGEDGLEVVEDFRRGAHTIVQGVTRSGKSVLTYGVLAQLAGDQAAIVVGCDPTGLLWRPFAGSRHAPWQVSGVGDSKAHELLVLRLVDEMDSRIRDLPADRDTIEVSVERPLLVVVHEELAGLYRSVDVLDKEAGKRIKAMISRLLRRAPRSASASSCWCSAPRPPSSGPSSGPCARCGSRSEPTTGRASSCCTRAPIRRLPTRTPSPSRGSR